MKLKTLGARARPRVRMPRHRSPRPAKVRPVQAEGQQQRVWSLLLPPGFPADRR